MSAVYSVPLHAPYTATNPQHTTGFCKLVVESTRCGSCCWSPVHVACYVILLHRDAANSDEPESCDTQSLLTACRVQ